MKSRILTLCCILVLLGGCKSKQDIYKGLSASQIYEQAQQNIKKEHYPQAVKDYEALEARYPYSEYSDKAQLGLVYAYYKSNEPALALSSANRFIQMNPRHKSVDYAYYLKGLINYDENYSFSFRYLPLDKCDRDASKAQESFDAFKELVERFPQSQYAADAKKRMVFLRNQIANHEMHVAQYYFKRSAFLAAANRANYVVKNFEGTPAVEKALVLLVKAYRKLNMAKLADDALATLKKNYPENKSLSSLSK